MANVKKVGIIGEDTAFEAEDSHAREVADAASAKAQEIDERFPISIRNGGTGGDSLITAREGLEIAYDAQMLLGLYEGRDLTEVFADEIADFTDEAEWFNYRIINGNFTGIRIFDYFDITLTDGKVFRYRVAAIDPYLHTLDQEITKHHIIMVPDEVWPDSVPWNTTNTNQGTSTTKNPYLVSNLHRWEINTFYPLLPQKWKNVIAPHRMLLEERYSTSTLTDSNSWSWQDVGKIFSLSEIEVGGFTSFGTKAYSTGVDCFFAEFFKTTKHRIRHNHAGERFDWWLRVVMSGSSASVCGVHDTGNLNSNAASHAGIRPLPCFRVGV